MKKVLSFSILLLVSLAGMAQESRRPLAPFQKIVVSPKIKLVLEKGDTESIRITARNIDASHLNVVVRGRKLHIYLDEARYIEKHYKSWEHDGRRKRMYADVAVTAYVTYRELKGVEMRGEESLICQDTLVARKFKLKAYGTNEMRFSSIQTEKFKAVLYGENSLQIASGTTGHQKYSLYGENLIETRGLDSKTAATTIYGEGKVAMHVSDEVRLNAFGEPVVSVTGPAHLSKGIVIGRVGIHMD